MTDDCVTKELPHDYVRRMRNWAKWLSGKGVVLISSIYEGESIRGDKSEPGEITINGEAVDTHKALEALAPRELQIVTLFWTKDRPSMRDLGARLHIDHKTAKVRLLEASRQHLAAIRRNAERVNAEAAANLAAIALSTANHARTGSVPTHISVALDRPAIPQ